MPHGLHFADFTFEFRCFNNVIRFADSENTPFPHDMHSVRSKPAAVPTQNSIISYPTAWRAHPRNPAPSICRTAESYEIHRTYVKRRNPQPLRGQHGKRYNSRNQLYVTVLPRASAEVTYHLTGGTILARGKDTLPAGRSTARITIPVPPPSSANFRKFFLQNRASCDKITLYRSAHGRYK